jgi:hypothetical protein
MSTYLELSESAGAGPRDDRAGSGARPRRVELWAATLAPLTRGQQLSIPFETPAPDDVLANSCGFAEQVVAASVPVVEAAAPTSK